MPLSICCCPDFLDSKEYRSMNYTVQSLDEQTKKLVFDFTHLDLTLNIKKELLKKQKTLKLKGFREGKAPLTIVQKIYGPTLEQKAFEDFIVDNVTKVVNKEDMSVIPPFHLKNLKYESGKSASFDIIVKVMSSLQLKDYSHFSFEEDTARVTDEDIELLKQGLIDNETQLVEFEDVNCSLKEGMTTIVDIKGRKKSGGRPDEVVMEERDCIYEIGLNRIPELDSTLMGMKVNDTKTFSIVCPLDFYIQNFRSEEVEFTVTILEIKKKIIPKFNDELVQRFDYESIDDFMNKCKKKLLEEKKKSARKKLYNNIVEAFIKENPYTVPKEEILLHQEKIKNNMKQKFLKGGMKEESINSLLEKKSKSFYSLAELEIKIDIVMNALYKDLGFQNKEDIDENKLITALSKKISLKLNNEQTTSSQGL